MAVNLDSLMHCCRRFKPALLPTTGREGGKVIIVSSIAGLGGSNVGNPAYAASKAGAMSLARTLGVAWAPEGIRVNGMAPGLVDTKLLLHGPCRQTRLAPDDPATLALPKARVDCLHSIGASRIGRLQPSTKRWNRATCIGIPQESRRFV